MFLRTRLQVVAAAVLFFALPAISVAASFQVARVTDGDTIRVRAGDNRVVIRLVGIDAPETSRGKNEPGQAFSDQASKRLASLVLNRTVEIKPYGQDRYGRTLAEVFVEGKNVNLEMVKAGLAEVYRGAPALGLDLGLYRKAEEDARNARLGMWQLGERYMSPGDWRHSK
jgi:endonuclease YncB( thermonuclease family)